MIATVTFGVYLSYSFWPVSVAPETLHGVWHTLEWLYNTVLFTLTGAIHPSHLLAPPPQPRATRLIPTLRWPGLIIGSEAFPPAADDYTGDLNLLQWEDFGWACVSYVFAILIRGVVVACLYPLLKRMGY